MKKKIAKIVTVTLVLLFTFSTGVYANEAYQRWAGSEEYEQTTVNIGLFETAYNALFNTKEQLVVDKENLNIKLSKTEAELALANENKDSITKERDSLVAQVNTLNGTVKGLETDLATAEGKIKDTDRLYGEVKTQLTNLIVEVNKSNGKGNRYDKLAVKVNQLAGYVGIEGRVDGNIGHGSKSEELKQAEIDMEDLEEKSDALLERIEEKNKE